jgi:hypothetical protein
MAEQDQVDELAPEISEMAQCDLMTGLGLAAMYTEGRHCMQAERDESGRKLPCQNLREIDAGGKHSPTLIGAHCDNLNFPRGEPRCGENAGQLHK